MRTILILAGTLSLAACATDGANTAAPPAGLDLSGGQFEGWARVTGEEIRLYAEQRDLRNAGSNACVSGALPRNAQRAAGDLNGSKIRLYGRTAAWSERGDRQTFDWQGSNITNSCRRDVVILAERVEVIR